MSSLQADGEEEVEEITSVQETSHPPAVRKPAPPQAAEVYSEYEEEEEEDEELPEEVVAQHEDPENEEKFIGEDKVVLPLSPFGGDDVAALPDYFADDSPTAAGTIHHELTEEEDEGEDEDD